MRDLTASVKGNWIAEMSKAGKDGAGLYKAADALIDTYTK